MRHAIIALTLALTPPVFAATPVAILEAISEAKSQFQPFDFLYVGDQIDLESSGSAVLGYFSSCVHETITGGSFTVGEKQSDTSNNSQVERTSQDCQGNLLALAANESSQSGATVYRDINTDSTPEQTLSTTTPVFLVNGTGKVTIKRIDQKAERITLRLRETTQRYLLDLKIVGKTLEPGGIYMITASGRSKVFQISNEASDEVQAVLQRMVIL